MTEKRERRWVKYAVTIVVCGGMMLVGHLCDLNKLFFFGLQMMLGLNAAWWGSDWAKSHEGDGFV